MTQLMTAQGMVRVPAGRWKVDPAHSSAAFEVKHMMIATVRGHFREFDGVLEAAEDDPANSRAWGTAKVASIDTGNAERDAHLRSPDFFDAERHPYVRFVSEAAELDGERLMVRGRLHARGTSMPLSVEATLRTVGDELEVEAVTDADHHLLGMTWNAIGMVRTPSKLMVKGCLVRDAA
jgi:polyisoprenoid-binding protein YceI